MFTSCFQALLSMFVMKYSPSWCAHKWIASLRELAAASSWHSWQCCTRAHRLRYNRGACLHAWLRAHIYSQHDDGVHAVCVYICMHTPMKSGHGVYATCMSWMHAPTFLCVRALPCSSSVCLHIRTYSNINTDTDTSININTNTNTNISLSWIKTRQE